MRMDLRSEVGPDGPEVSVAVDGVFLARADEVEGGYRVRRDDVPPELEPAVAHLEEVASRVVAGTGRHLGDGDVVTTDERRPSDREVRAARRGAPPYPTRT